MDVTSLAEYGLVANQAMYQQKMQVAMVKQSQSASEAVLDLVSEAAHSDVTVPYETSGAKGTIIDVMV